MMLEKGTVLYNLYKIIDLLGKGAMGNVYLVERLKDNKKLVVKEVIFHEKIEPDIESAKEMFFREAEIMAKFNHPGLPKMYGAFSQDEREYIAMDYIEGKTLEEILDSSPGPLEEEKAIKWALMLADILNYLHSAFPSPVVYRDIKPSNVIITPEGTPKLIDFGIARHYRPDKTTDTFRLGTPGYAAPEQHKNKGQSTPQTDIFGLGVLLFQMLAKYDPTLTPFKFPPLKSLNPSVSLELENTVSRAIELEPAKRYVNMQEFKEELEKYLRVSGLTRAPRIYPPSPSLHGSENNLFERVIKGIIAVCVAGLILSISGIAVLVYTGVTSAGSNQNSKEWYEKGLRLIDEKKYDEALKCYDKAISMNSGNLDAWYGKGWILYEQGRYEEVTPCCDRMLEINKNFIKAWILKGHALSMQKQYEDAIFCYDSALKINPKTIEAWGNKGIALKKMGRYEEAINCYDKVLESEPENTTILNEKGYAMNRLKQYEEAIKYWNRSLEIDPDNTCAKQYMAAQFAEIGQALRYQEKYKESAEYYRRAIDEGLNQPGLFNNYAWSLYKAGEYEEALIWVDKDLEKDYTGIYYAWETKGEILEAMGKYEEALDCYNKSLEIQPNFADSLERKALLTEKMKEK